MFTGGIIIAFTVVSITKHLWLSELSINKKHFIKIVQKTVAFSVSHHVESYLHMGTSKKSLKIPQNDIIE